VSRTRAEVLVWLLVSSWAGSLYLRAAVDPPPGRVFVGTFHWIDDFYNYASYIQQSEDGAWAFRNKLLEPSRTRPELVNLEWWLLGKVSLGLGRRPFLAYRLLAIAATLALVAGVERWLARAGLPASRRLPALALVFLGGGLGGLLFEATDLPVRQCGDLSLALFPSLEILANPHFVAGTALLVWALYALVAMPGPVGPLLGVGLGTVLGLVRPYDLALLVLIRVLGVAATEPTRRWPRALAPLVGFAPVVAYDLWVFFGSDQFASFQSGGQFPSRLEFVPALAPALLLALLAWKAPASGHGARRARAHLWMWVAVALVIIVVQPGSFGLQFLVGVGVPLLTLGALGLVPLAPRWTALAAVAFCTTAVVATRVVLVDDPHWFVPRTRMAAAVVLRDACRPGDLVFAHPDVGLYAIGLSSCHAVLAHRAVSDYEDRLAEATRFYDAATRAEDRADILDRRGVTHLMLPGEAGPRPAAWLGPRTPFERVAGIGAGPAEITIYSRTPAGDDPAREEGAEGR
jgi:hypothetical protein